MAQEGRRIDNLKTTDAILVLIDFEDRFYNVIDVALRVHASRNRQPQQLVPCRIAEHQRADLHATDAGVPVQLDGKRVSRVLNPEVWPRYAARFKETFGVAPEPPAAAGG